MILSIITINRNNASGLEKTISSVASQTCKDFEYIVVDGASTDRSVEVIRNHEVSFGGRLKWISEPDKGIYNAMNKGIKMASGDYLQFLNSGDCLMTDDVIDRMLKTLKANDFPAIQYGNMIKEMPNGKLLKDKSFAGKDIPFLAFYLGTLNHSPSFIKRLLFDKYGLYDESLKIVSDWKWFLQAIILCNEKPVYSDIDVTLFDMHGISETNKALDKAERRQVLNELIPQAIITDYELWSFPIEQMKRLRRHPWANRIVHFIERCLFKLEMIKGRKKNESEYR